jgi:hypothetical protein
MVYASLVTYFVFFERLSCITMRVVVDELVATGTEEHKVVYIVDVLWPRPFTSPRAIRPEGHHMGNLCEVALGQGEVVF